MMDTSISFLIVEDSLSFGLELRMILEELGYHVIGQAEDSGKALELIFARKPDIILMDIDINGNMSGTEIALHIKSLNIPIIFITSFGTKEHYDTAKRSNMFGYLIKPVSKYTLVATIESTLRNWNDRNQEEVQQADEGFYRDNIFIKNNELFTRVRVDDIQCIEAEGKSTYIYANNDRIATKYSLKELLSFLPANSFVKTHRSYILNLNYISTIDSTFSQVTLKNGYKILVSRQNKHELAKLVNIR